MAKRFTDTEKWSLVWFRKLKPKYKCVWFYLVDKCDHAGLWNADFEALSFNVGEDVTEQEFEIVFCEMVEKVSSDMYSIKKFIDFQYGNLNPNNKVHKSILDRLNKLDRNFKPLASPLDGVSVGAKEKEKDKDKDKDILLNNIILTKTKGDQESFDYTHPLDLPCDPPVKPKEIKFKPDLEALYKLYPRKEGKKKALERLNKIITSQEKFTQVETAIKNYARLCTDKETQFIKLFSSFVSVWEDYLTLPEKKLCDYTEDEALAYFEEKMSTPGKFGFGRDHV